MKNITGLDYSNSDMTIGQIDNFIDQLLSFNMMHVVHTICITGGEPLLHPNIEEIAYKLNLLKNISIISKLEINSNKLIKGPPPSIEKFIINYSSPYENKKIHNVVFLHPKDFSGQIKTYRSCTHYRKNRVVLNYQGYSLCCAGDAYIRLFGTDNLILDKLPITFEKFPIDDMNIICNNCPFSNDDILPFERDIETPISDIYKEEFLKNLNGRKITKRFLEKK